MTLNDILKENPAARCIAIRERIDTLERVISDLADVIR